MFHKSFILGLLVCAVSVPAYGHIIDNAPVWRGDERSTYQLWTFDDADNPAAPESYDNIYGEPSAAMTVGVFGSGWWLDELGLGTQSGYWDVGGDDGLFVLDIDNAVGGDYKLVTIQITYWQAIGGAPAISIPDSVPYMSENWTDELIEFDVLGSWNLLTATFMITPNPDHEQIILSGDANGSVVDQIIVDTICIPEPMTLVIMIGGGLLAVRRRR